MADYYGVGEGDLLQRRKKTAEQRKVAVYLCKVLSGKKNVEVGHMFGITIQAVTNTIRFMDKIKEGGGKLDKEIMRIKEILTPGR